MFAGPRHTSSRCWRTWVSCQAASRVLDKEGRYFYKPWYCMTLNFNLSSLSSDHDHCIIVKVWPGSDPRPRVPRQQLRGPAAALADTRQALALAEAAGRALLRREAGQCRHTSDEDCWLSRVTCVWRWSATTWRRSSGWSSPRSRAMCSAPRCVTWKVWCRRRQVTNWLSPLVLLHFQIWPPNVVSSTFVGKLYTIGGVQSKQVDQYDVEADRWRAVCSVT